MKLNRRRFLGRAGAAAALLFVSGCGPHLENIRDSSQDSKATSKVLSILRSTINKSGPLDAESTALVQMGDSAIPGMLSALRDEDQELRASAVWGLGEMVEQNESNVQMLTTVPPLIEALSDPYWKVRQGAAWVLGGLGRIYPSDKQMKGATPVLTTKLQDSKVEVRQAAAMALRTLGNASSIPPLMESLSDSEMTDYAQEALVALGDPVPLIAALSTTDEASRRLIIRVLGEMGAVATSQLIEGLANSDANIRLGCANALTRIGTATTAVPALERVLENDPDQRVRDAAQIAIDATYVSN
ncbi:HEAT repeat domain-containing protein [Candidatus Micrarchaeota archaeon]|nr:HEAT repeat domain-containing protein [Candidatus Micrarchaeota archaeon]